MTASTTAVLARSSTGVVHLVNEQRTSCGQRLTSLVVERGPVAAVTCRSCRRRAGAS